MSKHGIIGNADLAPLYDPALHPDIAAVRHRSNLNHIARSAGSAVYVAERRRPPILTRHGVMGTERIERITVGAPTIDDAIKAAREIAREYFEPAAAPWIIHNRKFTTNKVKP